jgi:hypothetical protein
MLLTILFCLFVLGTVCYAAALARAAGMPLPGSDNTFLDCESPGHAGPVRQSSDPHPAQARCPHDNHKSPRLGLLFWIGGTCR